MIFEYNGVFYTYNKIRGESRKQFLKRCFEIIKSNNVIESNKKINSSILGCIY